LSQRSIVASGKKLMLWTNYRSHSITQTSSSIWIGL